MDSPSVIRQQVLHFDTPLQFNLLSLVQLAAGHWHDPHNPDAAAGHLAHQIPRVVPLSRRCFQLPVLPCPAPPSRKHNNTACLALGRARFLTRQIQSRTPRFDSRHSSRHFRSKAPRKARRRPAKLLYSTQFRQGEQKKQALHCTTQPRCTLTVLLHSNQRNSSSTTTTTAATSTTPFPPTAPHPPSSITSIAGHPSFGPIVQTPADRLVAATSAPTDQPRQPNTGRQTSARRGNRPLFLPPPPPVAILGSSVAGSTTGPHRHPSPNTAAPPSAPDIFNRTSQPR